MKLLPKFGVELFQEKLESGTDVFLFKRKGMPLYIRATFFAGSRFDEIMGTAHFLEHMLVAGTEKFPTKNLIADYIQKTGGEFSASTDNNLLRFNIEIPEKEDISAGIKVMSECLTKSLFDTKTIGNERGAILSELNSKKSNPREYVRDVYRAILLQGTDAGRSTLGDEGTIKLITESDLRKFNKDFINLGRVCFVASGDIDINELKRVLESVELPKNERFKVGNPLPIIKNERLFIEKYPGVKQLQVVLSTRTSIESYREYCSIRLLSDVLGGGRGSRLVTKLRYENGLVYTIISNVFNSVDWGVFRVNFSCKDDDFKKATDMINFEFKKIINENIAHEELEDTKARLTKGLTRTLQTSESWVNFHEADCIFNPEEIKTPDDFVETINSLTLDDIKFVASKYLNMDNFYTAICGDYKIQE